MHVVGHLIGKDTNRFVKGVVSGWVYMIVSLVVGLWLVPFTLKYLSRPEYAIFAIATDLLAWLSLANLGVGAVFNSRGAQLMGRGDKSELNIIASTTFFTQLISSAIIMLAGVVVTIKPELIFSKESVNAEYIQLVVALLVTGYTISFIFQPLSSMLVANKQIHIDNYLKFGLLIIKTGLTVLFLVKGLKLLSLALSSIAATIIISSITWLRVRATLKDIKISLSLWRYDRFIYLLKNGIWFTVGGLAGIFILRMDSFLIGQYISLTEVTSYVITIKLYNIADTFHQQFFNTTRPYFAQTFGKGDMALLSKMHSLSYYLAFTSAFVIGILIMLINKTFITIWVGPDFFQGEMVNMLLCVNFILQASVLPNRIVLATTFYKIGWHNITRASEGILKLSISILLISQTGVKSVILGSIIGCLLFSTLFLNYLSGKLLKDNYWNKILFLCLVALIPAAFLITGNNWIRIPAYLGLIIITMVIFYLKEGTQLKLIYFQVIKRNEYKNEATQIVDQ